MEMMLYKVAFVLVVGTAIANGHVIKAREVPIPSIQLEYGVPSSLVPVDFKPVQEPEIRLPVVLKPTVEIPSLPETFKVPEINLPSFINKNPLPLGLPQPTVNNNVLPVGLPELPPAPVVPRFPQIDAPESVHEVNEGPVPEVQEVEKRPIVVPEIQVPHQVYGAPVKESEHNEIPTTLPAQVPVLNNESNKVHITTLPSLPPALVIPQTLVPVPHQVYGIPLTQQQIIFSPPSVQTIKQTSSANVDAPAKPTEVEAEPQKEPENIIQQLAEKKGIQLPQPSAIRDVSTQLQKQIESHHQAVVKQLQLKHQEIVQLLTPVTAAEPPTVREPIITAPNVQLVPYSVSVPQPTPNVAVLPNYLPNRPLIYSPHTVYGVPLNGPLLNFN
ncbi:hypothetical protein ACFFRR_010242 [Megaselia abdita]